MAGRGRRAQPTLRERIAAAPLEHESQAAFFSWWLLYAPTIGAPERLCFSVPNGSARHPVVAMKLKAEGVRSGVADVFLDIPANGFHGLRLEFKRVGNTVRAGSEQEAWLYDSRRMGYNALVVWSTEEAIRAVKAYLSGWKAPKPQPVVPMTLANR